MLMMFSTSPNTQSPINSLSPQTASLHLSPEQLLDATVTISDTVDDNLQQTAINDAHSGIITANTSNETVIKDLEKFNIFLNHLQQQPRNTFKTHFKNHPYLFTSIIFTMTALSATFATSLGYLINNTHQSVNTLNTFEQTPISGTNNYCSNICSEWLLVEHNQTGLYTLDTFDYCQQSMSFLRSSKYLPSRELCNSVADELGVYYSQGAPAQKIFAYPECTYTLKDGCVKLLSYDSFSYLALFGSYLPFVATGFFAKLIYDLCKLFTQQEFADKIFNALDNGTLGETMRSSLTTAVITFTNDTPLKKIINDVEAALTRLRPSHLTPEVSRAVLADSRIINTPSVSESGMFSPRSRPRTASPVPENSAIELSVSKRGG